MSDVIALQETKSVQGRVTVAHLLLGLVTIVAGINRLVGLEHIPFSPAEASHALQLWGLWRQGEMVGAMTSSPAYFAPASILFQLFGDSEAALRLVPALFGVGLVLLPWLLRRQIGVAGALVASLLLAISPTVSNLARTVGGDSPAIFAFLLVGVAGIRYLDKGSSRWLTILAVGLGFGFTSSPIFYTGLSAIGVGWLIQHWIGPPLIEQLPRPTSLEKRHAIIWGAGTFLGVATLFLWLPAGLGGAANELGKWVAQFDFNASALDWVSPILLFGRYEPILLLVGGIAGIWVTWRGYELASTVVYIIVAGIVLIFLQPGQVGNVAVLVVPASLLVGIFVEKIVSQPSQHPDGYRYTLAFTGILLLAGGIFTGMVARQLRIAQYNSDDFVHLWLALTMIALSIALVFYANVIDRAIAGKSSIFALLILLTAFTWGNSWWLNQQAANDTRTRWVQTATSSDVTQLVEVATETARQWGVDEQSVTLLATVDSPILRWYLRHFDQAQFGESGLVDTRHDLIITPQNAGTQLADSYFGTDFSLLNHDTPMSLGYSALMKYLLFREVNAGINQTNVILWVREDLITR